MRKKTIDQGKFIGKIIFVVNLQGDVEGAV